MKNILRAALILCLFACHAAAADAAKFIGTWAVDMERTKEEGKKSPRYNPKDDENMPQAFKDMIAKFKLRINDKEVVFTQRGKEMSLPYTVESGDDAKVVLAATAQGHPVKLTLTLVEEKFMNLKSSGTDDMDYFIWKKSD